MYLTYYDLLIMQDLWQPHYQILSIIFLKEFIELNVNADMIIKNAGLAELNISIASVFLNAQIIRWFNRILMFEWIIVTRDYGNQKPKFVTTDTKLYVPVVTL